MKKLLIAGVAALAVLAGCGVDKDKTGDNLVNAIEKQAGVDLDDTQTSCLKDLVKSYSDDDLTALSESKASEELTTDFGEKVGECLGSLDGGDVATDETVGS